MYDKMYVRGIFIKENKILLEKVKDQYQLPGGIVIQDEFLKEALVRNFLMKYGLHIQVRRGRIYDVNTKPLEYIYFVKTEDPILDSSLEWIPLDRFEEISFYKKEIKDAMLKHLPSYDEIEDVILLEGNDS